MYHPTIAERKTMISKLPPAPEGKVWKCLTEGKMKAGDHLFIESGGMIHIGEIHIGEIRIGAPFDGAPVSKLENYQSAWRLVAARKRPAKPADSNVVKDNPFTPASPKYRYAYSKKGKFIEKFSEDTYQVFYNDEVRPEQKRVDLYSVILSSIERGLYKEITRDQFLAKIKEWGFNEDGTKIVPLPKVRFFKHVDGFGDPLLFVALRPDETHYFIYKGRVVVEAEDKYWTKARCEEAVKDGNWIEAFQPEVDAALAPKPKVKTELELTREALTAANARISELESKIASAREVLS